MDNTNTPFPEGQNSGENQSFASNLPTNPDFQGAQGFQNMQSAPVAPPLPSETKKSFKKRYVVFGVLIALVLILGIILAFCLMNNTNHDNSGASTADNTTGSREESATRAVAFEDLTKEEAIAFLQSRVDNSGQAWPENFVGEEITNAVIWDDDSTSSDIRLIYSYGNIDELRQMAREKYNPSLSLDNTDETGINFEIKEYDYYAIVTPERTQGTTECGYGYYTSCDSLLAFKRDYLNYFSEETTPNSFNEVAYIETRDPKVVEELLRTFCFFKTNANIYSYDFEEQDDKFVLTLNYVGVGFDLDKVEESESNFDWSEAYAINLYVQRYAVDKSDGRVYGIPYKTEPEASYFERIKSFSTTQEEASSLMDLLMHESE